MLNLWDNTVQNLTPLAGLTNLKELELRYNFLDISPASPAMLVIQALEGCGADVYYAPQKPAPEPITLSDPAWLGGGVFQFQISGPPGVVLEVLQSTDLASWTHLDYVTNITGTVTYTDSTATSSRRFYRVASTSQ